MMIKILWYTYLWPLLLSYEVFLSFIILFLVQTCQTNCIIFPN